MFNLDPANLMLNFLFSSIGFVYLSFGRKQARPLMAVAGVVLMGYPFFVDSLAWLVGIGIALTALPFVIR